MGEIDVRCRRMNKHLTNSGVHTQKVSLGILVAQALRQEFRFVYTFCRKIRFIMGTVHPGYAKLPFSA